MRELYLTGMHGLSTCTLVTGAYVHFSLHSFGVYFQLFFLGFLCSVCHGKNIIALCLQSATAQSCKLHRTTKQAALM